MARGLVAGGIFFSTIALFCGVLARLGGGEYQSWLVQRTEIYDNICSRGAGIYEVGATFGDDLPGLFYKKRGKCQDDLVGKYFERPQPTMEAFCRTDNVSDYTSEMCVRTIISQCLALLSILFRVLAICAGLFCHAVASVRDEILPASMAAGFAMMASIVSWGVFVTMATSPLFSHEHFDVLSAHSRLLIPYRGIGCVFQEPFVSKYFPLLILDNWPQECLLFGYGYALAVCEASFSFLASLIFGLVVLDLKTILKRHTQLLQDSYGTGQRTLERQSLIEPIIEDSVTAATEDEIGTASSSSSVTLGDTSAANNVTARPQPISTRFSGSGNGIASRFVAALGGVSEEGALPASHTQQETSNEDSFEELQRGYYSLYGAFHRHLAADWGWLTRRVIATGVPLMLVSNLALTMTWMMTGCRFSMQVTLSGLLKKQFVYEVFDFNSITSVTDFWDGGAHLMSLLTFLATFFVPTAKFVVWLYLWYIPCGEARRGHILAWADALGIVALANVFSMTIMCVGFLFTRTLDFKVLEADIRVGVNSGFLGTWCLITSSVLSLVTGQWFVFFHGIAARWEQIRRKGRKAALHRRPSLFRAMDTPFFEMIDQDGFAVPAASFRVVSPFFSYPGSASSAGSASQRLLTNSGDAHGNGNSNSNSNSNGNNSSGLDAPSRVVRASSHLSSSGSIVSEIHYRAGAATRYAENPDSWGAFVAYWLTLGGTLGGGLRSFQFTNGRYRFSRVASALVDICLFACLALTLTGLFVPVLAFERVGLVGNLVVNAEDRFIKYSVADIVKAIHNDAIWPNDTLLAFSSTMVAFIFIFPLLHYVGLFLVWRGDIVSIHKQETVFRFVEMSAAWNAIPIFLVCVVVSRVDISMVADTVIPQVVPTLVSWSSHIGDDGLLFAANQSFQGGFWVLFAGSVLQITLTYLIMPLSATAIAQQKLSALLNTGQYDHEEEEDHRHALQILSPTARYIAQPTTKDDASTRLLMWMGILVDSDNDVQVGDQFALDSTD